MSPKLSERRKYRMLCRREKQVLRILTVFVIVVSVGLSSFFAAMVRVDNTKESTEVRTEFKKYYAQSAEQLYLLSDEIDELNGTEYDNSESAGFMNADKDSLGEAVGNIYGVIASMNLQKYMMSNEEQITSTENDNADELSDQPELEPEDAPEQELIDETPSAVPQTSERETETDSSDEEISYETEIESETEPVSETSKSVNNVVSSSKGTVELDENGIPVSFKKVLTGVATAYSGDPMTATGTVPTYGTVAVNPKIIPYGSLLYIVTADGSFVYGVAKAEDTGGFIRWNNPPIADLYFDTEAECYEFGRRNVIIYVIE